MKKILFIPFSSGIQEPADAPHDLIAKIIAQATPGLDAREYATRVLRAIRQKSHDATFTPNSTVTISSLLPSFIESTFYEATSKENVQPKASVSRGDRSALEGSRNGSLRQRTSFIQRHSSPKKSQDRRDATFSNLAIDLAKSRLVKSTTLTPRAILAEKVIDPVSTNKQRTAFDFPIECDHPAVVWIGTGQSENQEQQVHDMIIHILNQYEKLRNFIYFYFPLTSNPFNIIIFQVTIRSVMHGQTILLNLMIRDSNSFSFANKKRTLQLTLKPDEIKKIPLTFSSAIEGGWNHGKLILKPQGFSQPRSSLSVKRFKATIPLQGYSGRPKIVFESPNFVVQVLFCFYLSLKQIVQFSFVILENNCLDYFYQSSLRTVL